MGRTTSDTVSPEEIRELKALLRRRKESFGPGNLDFSGMAQRVAASIKQQMGLSRKALRETAVDTVSRLIRASAPDISEHDLGLMLQEMIPSMVAPRRSPLPTD